MEIKILKTAEDILTEEVLDDDYDKYSLKVNGTIEGISQNNRVINVLDKYGKVLARIQVIDDKQIPSETVLGNKGIGAGDFVYKVPTCPICKEPTYNYKWCPSCGKKLKVNIEKQ